MASPERNVQLRYLMIDACLHQAAVDPEISWSKEALLAKVNEELIADAPNAKPVAMRTLEKDLVDIERVYRVRIDKVRKEGKVHLRYTDPDQRLHRGILAPEESLTVQRFLKVMERFEGMPEWDWWLRAQMGLKGQFGLFDRPGQRAQAPRLAERSMSKDERRWYAVLAESVFTGTPLRMAYAPNMGDSSERTSFLPRQLVHDAEGIFALGTAWDSESETHFHLIVELVEITSLDRVAVDWPDASEWDVISWDRYAANRMGLQSGIVSDEDAEPAQVRVWVADQLAQRFLKEPMHASQDMRIEQAADGVIFNLALVPDEAFMRFALKWGQDFQVLEPDDLRHALRVETKANADRYAPMFGP